MSRLTRKTTRIGLFFAVLLVSFDGSSTFDLPIGFGRTASACGWSDPWNCAKDAYDKLKAEAGKAVEAVSTAARTVGNVVVREGSKSIEWIKSAPSDLAGAAKNLAGQAFDEVRTIAGEVYTALSEALFLAYEKFLWGLCEFMARALTPLYTIAARTIEGSEWLADWIPAPAVQTAARFLPAGIVDAFDFKEDNIARNIGEKGKYAVAAVIALPKIIEKYQKTKEMMKGVYTRGNIYARGLKPAQSLKARFAAANEVPIGARILKAMKVQAYLTMAELAVDWAFLWPYAFFDCNKKPDAEFRACYIRSFMDGAKALAFDATWNTLKIGLTPVTTALSLKLAVFTTAAVSALGPGASVAVAAAGAGVFIAFASKIAVDEAFDYVAKKYLRPVFDQEVWVQGGGAAFFQLQAEDAATTFAALKESDPAPQPALVEPDRLFFLVARNGDFSQATPDAHINYLASDGSKWTARLGGSSGFLHAPLGDFARVHSDDRISHRSWDPDNPTVYPGTTYWVDAVGDRGSPDHIAGGRKLPGVYFSPGTAGCALGNFTAGGDCGVIKFSPPRPVLREGVNYWVDTNPQWPGVYYAQVGGACPHGGGFAGPNCQLHLFSSPAYATSLKGAGFFQTPADGSVFPSRDTDVIRYLSWDGTRFAAKLVDRKIEPIALPPPGEIPQAGAFLHAPDGDFARAHQDVNLNYVTWGGGEWTARLEGGRFLHTRRGAPSGHPDVIMNYVTWDGGEWTAHLAGAQVRHVKRGAADGHTSDVIDYTTWGGGKWRARIVPQAPANPAPKPAPVRPPGFPDRRPETE
ncbi:MAG: hypothetical protein HYY84_09320 [Deltaproteobacteria bacterium]|nr:hypothetical protein [Deltaproteobacteria bacterium]